MRLPVRLPVLLLLPAACALSACPTADDDDSTPVVSSTLEYQDIFIPDRIIEIPVLPAGTQVVSEVAIHNAGDKPLLIDEIALNYQSDDNWTLVDDTVPTEIAPHQQATVEVLYEAHPAVDTFAALDVYSDDPDEAEMTVAFIGRQATGGPHARVSANILDWGFRFTGEETRKILEIRNDGDEPMNILSVELVQSEAQVAYHIACPGEALDACDWNAALEPQLLLDPIVPGSGALLELAFVPLNLQAVSAQLKIATSDPLRPLFTIYLLGNGQSAINCTAPHIEVTSPQEATFYFSWQTLEVSARVSDQEQPPGSMYVEMFLGDLLIEDEFPDENGFVHFSVDIDEHEPPLPSGLQPFTLKVTDGCPLSGYDTFVAAIEFPLSSADVDGDGFDPNQGDCNDNDLDIFPQAIEQQDGKDNNCNGVVDENTGVWDDDCDGYCEDPPCMGQGPAPDALSACTGLAADAADVADCNDSTGDLDGDGAADGHSIFPGAPESLNFIDDDCDGTTDEGTSYFDDDEDGQTEAAGDCDDENAEVFAGATEWCDGLDNDCDGTFDDDCIDRYAPPRIIGGIITNKFQVQLGERVQAQVIVVSNDEGLTYEWFSDMGGTYDPPANNANVIWIAPPDDEVGQGFLNQFPTLMVTVTDSLGQVAYGFGNVLLNDEVRTGFAVVGQSGSEQPTCSMAAGGRLPSVWAGAVAALGLGFGARRRHPRR